LRDAYYDTEGGNLVFEVAVEDDSEEPTKTVKMPVADFLTVYGATSTATVTLTLDGDNKFVANVNIDDTEGNAIEVVEGKGLRVDVTGKANKVDATNAGKVLVASSEGDLEASVVTVGTDDDVIDTDSAASTLATEKAVYALISRILTSLESKYDEIGAAATAETNAKSYADELVSWEDF
jgi:hypothetical protein